MNFIESVQTCLLEKYWKFSGRAQRSEFWWFYLLVFVFLVVDAISDNFANASSSAILYLISLVIKLLLVLPTIAATVRRLHDTDKSGWLYGIFFIPIIGFFILMYLCAVKGTPGPNQFGPDPLTSEQISASATPTIK